jgi:AP-2 complex subunit mu-1
MYINLGSQRVATTAQEDRKMTSTITGARDWRREGIVHKTNEVFLDVLESVNLLLSTTGTVLRNDVTGVVRDTVCLFARLHHVLWWHH